jgi:hypothetical protein
MTRKDYIAIAAAIKGIGDSTPTPPYYITPDTRESVLATVADALADVMATDNARFNRKRFFAACGVE